jgi:hypothetical protein
MRRHHLLLAAPAAALALALPGAATASTLTPTKSCFSRVPVKGSEPLTFTITGGVPGGRFLVSNPDGLIGSVSGTFDAAGNATSAITDFSVPGGGIDPVKGKTVPLQVQEYGGPFSGNVTGGGNVTVTLAALDISNRSLNKPYSRRTWVMSGLTPLFGKGTLYATWIASGHKKATKISRLGRPDACGYLRVKRSASPVRHSGRWKIYVHVGKKLDKKKSLIWNWRVYRF